MYAYIFALLSLFFIPVVNAINLDEAISKHDLEAVKICLSEKPVSLADKLRYLDLAQHAIQEADWDYTLYQLNGTVPTDKIKLDMIGLTGLLASIGFGAHLIYEPNIISGCGFCGSLIAICVGFARDSICIKDNCKKAVAIKQLLYQA